MAAGLGLRILIPTVLILQPLAADTRLSSSNGQISTLQPSQAPPQVGLIGRQGRRVQLHQSWQDPSPSISLDVEQMTPVPLLSNPPCNARNWKALVKFGHLFQGNWWKDSTRSKYHNIANHTHIYNQDHWASIYKINRKFEWTSLQFFQQIHDTILGEILIINGSKAT